MASGPAKQRRTRFVKEFLKDRNASRAAIAAGYSKKTAGAAASRLLKDVKIAAAIDRANERFNRNSDLTVERIKQELARLAFYDPRDFYNEDGTLKSISELDDDAARMIAGFDCVELFEGSGDERSQVGVIKKFKFPDKTRALELAMRHKKMLTDRVEVSTDDNLLKALMEGRKRAQERNGSSRRTA